MFLALKRSCQLLPELQFEIARLPVLSQTELEIQGMLLRTDGYIDNIAG